MKKVVVLFVVFCVLAGAAKAQISASPFEGRWVWNEEGDFSEIAEMVFFGNILLVMEDLFHYYIGIPFSHAGGIISTEDADFEWQYRLSGNTLHLTNEDGINVSFTRVPMQRSPKEGLWRVIETTSHDPDESEEYVLFTGDIMAITEEEGLDYWLGWTIEFEGRAFRPSLRSLGFEDELDFIPEDDLEAYLASLLMEYSISGNYLTLSHQGESIRLRRVH